MGKIYKRAFRLRLGRLGKIDAPLNTELLLDRIQNAVAEVATLTIKEFDALVLYLRRLCECEGQSERPFGRAGHQPAAWGDLCNEASDEFIASGGP